MNKSFVFYLTKVFHEEGSGNSTLSTSLLKISREKDLGTLFFFLKRINLSFLIKVSEQKEQELCFVFKVDKSIAFYQKFSIQGHKLCSFSSFTKDLYEEEPLNLIFF